MPISPAAIAEKIADKSAKYRQAFARSDFNKAAESAARGINRAIDYVKYSPVSKMVGDMARLAGVNEKDVAGTENAAQHFASKVKNTFRKRFGKPQSTPEEITQEVTHPLEFVPTQTLTRPLPVETSPITAKIPTAESQNQLPDNLSDTAQSRATRQQTAHGLLETYMATHPEIADLPDRSSQRLVTELIRRLATGQHPTETDLTTCKALLGSLEDSPEVQLPLLEAVLSVNTNNSLVTPFLEQAINSLKSRSAKN